MEIETQSYITNLLKTNPKIVENNLNYNDKKFNKKKIGDYQIVEYNYMGDMESALVEDSRGKKWIMSGDGFTSV